MSSANILASILFGSVGLAAFVYGKKQSRIKPLATGLALMIYPYFVQNTAASFAIGAVLTVSLFMFRGD